MNNRQIVEIRFEISIGIYSGVGKLNNIFDKKKKNEQFSPSTFNDTNDSEAAVLDIFHCHSSVVDDFLKLFDNKIQ